MTLTRTPLNKCRTKDCPFTPDEHDEWMDLCSRAPEHGHRHDQPSHQHWPKRSQGGKEIVAVLCWPMHDRIDNFDWGNDVKEVPGRGRVYFAWDLHGNTLIERDIDDPALNDGAEARGSLKAKHRPGTPEIAGSIPAPDKTSALSSSAGLGGEAATPPQVSPSPPLTHEQRVAKAKAIKDAEWGRQWLAGDTANAWRAEMGEEAEQYISDFGYVQESIANIMYVCEKIPKRLRGYNLRFSHFVVVAGESLEDMEMHLDKCEEEQWSVAEFRRQVKGTKPRVKRWAVTEMREVLRAIDAEPAQTAEEAMISIESIAFFLDRLEEQP